MSIPPEHRAAHTSAMRSYFLVGLLMVACGGITTSTSSDAGPAADARPTPDGDVCAGTSLACVTRDDCCNRRHSCIDGTCMYSAPATFTDATPAELVDYDEDIQPLLLAKCAACHDGDAGQAAFVRSHAVMLQASRLCPGERVGECVNHALQAQAPEGSTCRTYIVRPFHREGWPCLSATEIERVAAWVRGGMVEHE
jgi:hypothetical protein